jgi:hypothetical protein
VISLKRLSRWLSDYWEVVLNIKLTFYDQLFSLLTELGALGTSKKEYLYVENIGSFNRFGETGVFTWCFFRYLDL